MSNQLGTYVGAFVAGVIGAFVAQLLLNFNLVPKSLVGTMSAPAAATIQLTQNGTNCRANTIPHRVPVNPGGVVTWTVTGACDGIDVNQVELRFVGECQADGSKRAGSVPDLFNEPPPHKGRVIRRTVRHRDESCFAYEVIHGTTRLQDPEFEIVY